MKDRYIYKIYKDSVSNIHCQRFPIIYSNDQYIYYKEAGCKELTKVEVYRVHKTYSDTVEFGYFNSEPPQYIRDQFPNAEVLVKVERLKVGIRQHQYEIDYFTKRIDEHRQRMSEKIIQLNDLLSGIQAQCTETDNV